MKLRPRSAQTAQSANDFDELFQTHWEQVNDILFRLVEDADEAEDLALETFWRLHQHLQARQILHNPGGWLYRVSVNLGYNALRTRRRRQAYERSAGRAVFDAHPLDPSQVAEQEQTRALVRQVLSALPKRTAQILVLRHSGLSYAEIAQALRVAPGSVGTLLARAEDAFARRYGILSEMEEN